MIVHAGLEWYTFYYFMLGAAGVEWVTLMVVYWEKTGDVYRKEHPREDQRKGGNTREAVKSKITWLCAVFFFTYMGIEGQHHFPTIDFRIY
jgi:hypothetical protein